MRSGYVKCKTANIYYEVYGEGRPILFLHGNGEDMTYFKYQKETLKDKYKLIFIDSRGHGKSSFGNEKLSLGLMSKDIISVLRVIGVGKVDLLGFSDGGNIALLMAISNPELFRSLTLVGANLKPDDLVLRERNQIKEEILVEKDEKKKLILKLMINEPNISVDELRKINIQSLIIAGENDLIEERCTRNIAKNIKNSRLEIIDGADHFLISKVPKKFNHIFTSFINNL